MDMNNIELLDNVQDVQQKVHKVPRGFYASVLKKLEDSAKPAMVIHCEDAEEAVRTVTGFRNIIQAKKLNVKVSRSVADVFLAKEVSNE